MRRDTICLDGHGSYFFPLWFSNKFYDYNVGVNFCRWLSCYVVQDDALQICRSATCERCEQHLFLEKRSWVLHSKESSPVTRYTELHWLKRMIPKPWQEETNAWVLPLLVPSSLFGYENKFKFFFSFSQSSKLLLASFISWYCMYLLLINTYVMVTA